MTTVAPPQKAAGNEIKEQVRRGIRWVSLAQIVTHGVWLVGTPILARLLEASDFGLFYTASVALGFFGSISSLGLNTAVIQRRDLSEDELQTAFWASVGAGALVFTLGALAMPLIAWIYRDERLIGVGIAYAATFLSSSLMNMPLAFLAREMRFAQQVIVSFTSAVLSATIAISSAYLGFGVYSLVWGALIAQTVASVLALRLARFRLRLHFRWDELKKLRRFSLYLAGELGANYLYNNLDYLAVGYVLGTKAHGFYTQAFNLAHFPYSQMTPPVTKVMFAAFARQQKDDAALREGYLNATSGLAVVTAPILAFLGVATEFVVGGYLGEKWISIIPYVRILAVLGALKCVVSCVGLIINAKGRSDIGFRWNLFSLVIMAGAMGIGVRHGVMGVCWAWLIVFMPLSVAIKAITHSLVALPARVYLARMARPVLFVLAFTGLLVLARSALAWALPAASVKTTGLLLLVVALPPYAFGVRFLCPGVWYGIFGQPAEKGA
ncbi:lipopolysaccharide biosynthesis protein [Polyangium sp. y55x31]|uniref:lipopolysaccharide biosynthesis protein n=1 Tax=Polyangium sp. y55x31 TaxID=3042688 RepID=UPI0024828AC8|nr:lipopolysaccharide biosynthesis protein [Polyangium sp. y55x31]MDI1483763.1 lipopolysaccharide biosynthesis protein [Polyangium sp. y55x31]